MRLRTVFVGGMTVLGVLLQYACGHERPRAGGASGVFVAERCSAPTQGCTCSSDGQTVACGQVAQQVGDWLTCSMGHRSCIAGFWGPCSGETLVSTRSLPLHANGISSTSVPCTNPCDPYCREFKDDALGLALGSDSGLALVDGGLTIVPTGAGSASVSTGFAANPAGVTACTPNAFQSNVLGGASRSCTYPDLATCQQDFHCDAATNKCLWNGGPGYRDATCDGVDLTVGAPCGNSGSTPPTVPLCNRGTADLPSGVTITLHESNGAQPPNACKNLGAPTCSYTLPFALTAGQCISLAYCQNSPGAKFVTVNAGVPGQAPSAGGPEVVECANAPGGARCANNSAFMKTDGAPGCSACQSCDTRISGKVYDPSGTSTESPPPTGANDLPLPGVTVFQPAGPLTVFTDGVACDSCASLESPYQTAAVTDSTGAFLLHDVSPAANGDLPIVVQTGRWRRKVHVTSGDLVAGGSLVACQDNPIKPGRLRLPRSVDATVDNPGGLQAGVSSDIPKTALVIGNREALECWVRKIGVADSEIRLRRPTGNSARFQLFRTNGVTIRDVDGVACTSSTQCNGVVANTSERACVSGRCQFTPPAGSASASASGSFYGSSTVMNEFAAALLPCDSEALAGFTTYEQNLRDYTARGGRLFLDHLTGEEFLRDGQSPLDSAAVSTWQNWTDPPVSYAIGFIPSASAPQTAFRDWMLFVGASLDGAATMRSYDPKKHALVPGSAATEWIRGKNDNAWNASHSNGDFSLSLSVETGYTGSAPPPVGTAVVGKSASVVTCGVPGGTGRVVFNGMHVSQSRITGAPFPTSSSYRFPTDCTTGALSSEEKALEYQLFQLTACQVGGGPPPPPPTPPPALAEVEYVRDYHVVCAPGTRLKWRLFSWQAIVPVGTQVQFRAASAATQGALPATAAPAPTTVDVGTADTTVPTGPPPAPQWGADDATVDANLAAQSTMTSEAWLRIFMRFLPNNSVNPPVAPTLTGWKQSYDCEPAE